MKSYIRSNCRHTLHTGAVGCAGLAPFFATDDYRWDPVRLFGPMRLLRTLAWNEGNGLPGIAPKFR